MAQSIWKTVWQFLIKLNILITQSKNCALWYLTKELKPMSAQLSPHAVFLIVKPGNNQDVLQLVNGK